MFLIGTFCIALNLYLSCNARLTVYWRAYKFSKKEQIYCFFTFNTDWMYVFWVDAYRCYSDAEKPRRIEHSVKIYNYQSRFDYNSPNFKFYKTCSTTKYMWEIFFIWKYLSILRESVINLRLPRIAPTN